MTNQCTSKNWEVVYRCQGSLATCNIWAPDEAQAEIDAANARVAEAAEIARHGRTSGAIEGAGRQPLEQRLKIVQRYIGEKRCER